MMSSHCVAVVVDVEVEVPVPVGSLAEAMAATEPATNPGSAAVAAPEALCVAASVVPAAPAAKAALEPTADITITAIEIFLNILTSGC